MSADQVKRGHSRNNFELQDSKRESCFFASKIAEHFEFRADWYRQAVVAELVLSYYVVLRSVVKGKPDLREYLTRCRYCGVFFLNDPRNAGRDDLGCPFGCAHAHRKQGSHERSGEYYRSEDGRVKKRALNKKRRAGGGKRVPSSAACPEPDNGGTPARLIAYLAALLTLIEEREVTRVEIVELLQRVVRQHSMVRQNKIEHSVARLKGASP